MSTQALNTRKQRVFDSVFGAQSISLPTPHATPATGFTAPGQTWGGPLPGNLDEKLRNSLSEARGLLQPSRGLFLDADDHVEDQVRWDRAWHLVTHTLSLPNFKGDGMEREILKPEPEQLDEKFYGALERVISPGTCLPLARQTEDVVVWFTSQVRHNFLHEVLPIVLRLRKQYVQESLLGRSIKALEMANRQYFHGLWFIAQGIENAAPGESKAVTEKFRRDLNAVITNSVMEPLGDALMCVLRRQVSKVLGLPPKQELESSTILPEGPKTEKARHEMLGLVEALQNVGLAGERFQVTFAEIMNDSMTEYVHRGCEGVWSPNDHEKNRSSAEGRDGSILPRTAHHASPSRCVTELCEWIEDRYAKLAVQVFSVLKIKGSISWTDKEKYKEMSIGRLAELRINELFDIVVNWPHSSGALDDLRTAITTPQRRLHLTEVFAKTLQDRLLHPGASTLQILQTYISMIWSFHALDHSKVLLDRVAYPLQLYLCSREDTVRIIITGLLSDTEDGDGNPVKNTGDKLVELAQLLNKGPEEFGQRPNDEELDWHDMDWVPDPVDAGPGYKRSKSADIIGTLIGVLGAQEVFIKEFQNIIGENLLRQDGDFDKEVLSLFLINTHRGTNNTSRSKSLNSSNSALANRPSKPVRSC
jgi:anaphase-promoting complex subunit 2